MADGTVVCPECGARLWYNEEVRCVCGHKFRPDQKERFLTGAEKKKLQQSGASPAKGPQPVTGRKRPTKNK